jgi:predicted nucleic acid-binding Zn ribbon protein
LPERATPSRSFEPPEAETSPGPSDAERQSQIAELMFKATMAEKEGDSAAAAGHLRAILEIDPGHAGARGRLDEIEPRAPAPDWAGAEGAEEGGRPVPSASGREKRRTSALDRRMGRSRTTRPRKCPECGAEVPAGSRTCESCGARVPRPRRRRGGFLRKFVILLLLVVILGAGGVIGVGAFAGDLLPPAVRDVLKSVGLPVKMRTAGPEPSGEPEAEQPDASAEGVETASPENAGEGAEEQPLPMGEGPSAREAPIPGLDGGLRVPTAPDLGGEEDEGVAPPAGDDIQM